MLKRYGPSWEKPGYLTAILDHRGGELIVAAAVEHALAVQEGIEETGPEEAILTDMPDKFEDAWLRATVPFMKDVEKMLLGYADRSTGVVQDGEWGDDSLEAVNEMRLQRLDDGLAARALATEMTARRMQSQLFLAEESFRRQMIEIPSLS